MVLPNWKPENGTKMEAKKKDNANIKLQRPSTDLPIKLMRQSQLVEKVSGREGV